MHKKILFAVMALGLGVACQKQRRDEGQPRPGTSQQGQRGQEGAGGVAGRPPGGQSGTQPGSSGEQGQRTGPQPGGAAGYDQQFIQQAASTSLFEVQSSKLVLDKEKNLPSKTKEYAETIVEDHQEANQKLKEVAQKAKITVPPDMLQAEQEKLRLLENAQGPAVMDTYLQQQEATHVAAINIFEKCSRECQNEEIREFASNTLDTLKEHKENVPSLQ